MHSIDHRRPKEFQRVRSADECKQPDGTEVDAGSPDENPRKSTISTRGLRYTARLSRQLALGVTWAGLVPEVTSGAVILTEW
jgi:hypothetical protein